ncbi:hypothetical protein I7I50_12530 [Histoplasma capsulatum G186AR]|uniref:Uncharacterized protein n=1 Tax=Ajellomyces capsulatus TaxID=5037 RepID=A0A8H8CQW3_AJECA|nr:hypothetical protein I7I52_11164 [Histoplasma capsulatum]QSS70787.1 hypothetical protein I7I50_12530 [Histoplasma capsulatum G186AR]
MHSRQVLTLLFHSPLVPETASNSARIISLFKRLSRLSRSFQQPSALPRSVRSTGSSHDMESSREEKNRQSSSPLPSPYSRFINIWMPVQHGRFVMEDLFIKVIPIPWNSCNSQTPTIDV